jgi:amino acid adenylation domain-containing protein
MGQESTMEKEVFVFPPSFAQQRLWFINQLEPNSSVYNIPSAIRLEGPLGVTALEQSFNEIIRRHEALRTTFSTVEGEPVQVISPSLTLPLTVLDLGNCPESEREDVARRFAREEARRPFDLARGPLVRMTLVRLGREDHILLFTMHHILSDGWSMGVLHRELSVLYRAFVKGEPSPLPDLSIQYTDFAVWQREWLQGEVLEKQLSYWKKQLEGIPGVLNLPMDHPRPTVQSYRGARRSIQLSKELTQGLKVLSRKEGVTLFMTLLAAFQTLLYRYTGQDDIVIGSPIANRNRAEIEGLIGFFVNTLVLRANFSGNPTFKEMLAQVRETALGAYAHQDLPFEKLVEELKPERSLSHSPLFQVMFVLQNARDTGGSFEGLRASRAPIGAETAKFDLLLSIAEDTERLRGSLEYSTDLFEGTTIDRLLGHFQILLEGVIGNPEQRISNLPLLTQAEQHQLLVEWNNTQRDYPKDKCIHQLFEEQVEKTPDAIAVLFEEQQLTYGELNRRANQLARYLVKQGMGPDTLVAICMERSLEMVVGLLGILKAGGAYVPLDRSYPKERLAFMLEDSQVGVLLTQERIIESLPDHSANLVCLDRDWKLICQESCADPDSGATADNLGYAIYTSGSTGKPKAVAMSHGSLCNLLWWQLQNFAKPVQAKTLQFASLSFDVSFQEIFTTWCSGGTLLLVSEEVRRDAAGLLHFLRDESVERLFLPYVALQQLAEVADNEGAVPTTLREVITAGEQLFTTRSIVELFTRLSDCRLRNQYGPSESHVVSAFNLTDSPSHWPSLPSIGQPIANTEIYILDPYLALVPIGVTGELYIGGVGLARGYLHRPELTAEKFIPNRFSSEPGSRLYKSGDLGRYFPDGNIEFLGRIDHQIKIRGFRIELREIETVLSQHAAVREAVVLAREEVENPKSQIENLKLGKRLVAYVVPVKERACNTSELRNFVKQKLPDYMVPSAFVFLDGLPLTPNGKINRKALPDPEDSSEPKENFVAPRTPVEELLAEIWAGVLKLDTVGIHDNFFDLGGHSLKATQVMSRVRETLAVDLPLRVLFEAPTVAELASGVEQSIAEAGELEEFARNMAEVEALSEEEMERQLEEARRN